MGYGENKLRDITTNQGANDRELYDIFVFDNRFEEGTFENTTGADLDLVGGEVIARDSASGNLVVLESGGNNGTNLPVGINATCGPVADGATLDINICVFGTVVKERLIFQGGDTLETVVSNRQLGDRIASDTMGIKLEDSDNLTEYDN